MASVSHHLTFSKTANPFAGVQGIFPCRGVGGREALLLFGFAAAGPPLTDELRE